MINKISHQLEIPESPDEKIKKSLSRLLRRQDIAKKYSVVYKLATYNLARG